MSKYVENLEKTVNDLQDRLAATDGWCPRWHRDIKDHIPAVKGSEGKDCHMHWYASEFVTYAYILPVIQIMGENKIIMYSASFITSLCAMKKKMHTKNFISLDEAKTWVENYTRHELKDVVVELPRT
jgi:hypothetical protein